MRYLFISNDVIYVILRCLWCHQVTWIGLPRRLLGRSSIAMCPRSQRTLCHAFWLPRYCMIMVGFLYRKVELIFTAPCIFQSIQMYRIVRVFWKVLRAEVFLEDRHAQNLYVIGQMFKLFGTLKVLSRSYLPGSVQSPWQHRCLHSSLLGLETGTDPVSQISP